MKYVKSLLEFQRRVLTQGIPNPEMDLSELKQCVFFNKVFISNCDEMFEKYYMDQYIVDYAKLVILYNNNIRNIIEFMRAKGINIRYDYGFEQRLLITTEIGDQIIRKKCNSAADISDLKYDGIYFITDFGNKFMVSFIDPKRNVYNKPFKHDGLYYDTINSIINYTDELYGGADITSYSTTAFKLTKNRDGVVTKVEFSGDSRVAEKLHKMAWKNAVVIANDNIYIDYLDQILDEHVNIVTKEMQNEKSISALTPMSKDVMIEYPSSSFDMYLYFLKSSLTDPNIKSISITLYRIGKDPSIFYILRDAVSRGVKVTAYIELNARGDELLNRFWAKEFIKAGIIVLRQVEKKVHCKATLIEFANDRASVQIGTGNYHTKTSTQYTDLNVITSDDEICKCAKKLFKDLKNNNLHDIHNEDFLYLENLKRQLIKSIDVEIKKGTDGFIFIKCNALDDPDIVKKLEEAEASGCKVELVIRSGCVYEPHSPNIRLRSIVWDKLEHSRVWCFGNTNPIIYLGSLDCIKHKFERRLEVMVKIKDPDVMMQMVEYVNRYIGTKEGWIYNNGTYVKEEL